LGEQECLLVVTCELIVSKLKTLLLKEWVVTFDTMNGDFLVVIFDIMSGDFWPTHCIKSFFNQGVQTTSHVERVKATTMQVDKDVKSSIWGGISVCADERKQQQCK
jgi:hypothetical protein